MSMTSNLETLLGKLEVTQEDRDAAAALARTIARDELEHLAIDALIEGRSDDAEFVQAFARHRLATIRDLSSRVETARVEALEEALEELLEANELDWERLIAAKDRARSLISGEM